MVVLGHPRSYGAVVRTLDGPIGRHKRSGPMMLRPVEFDSARKPRAGKAHQCRLDYFLMIKDVVVSIGLILDRVNASPEVWQKQNRTN